MADDTRKEGAGDGREARDADALVNAETVVGGETPTPEVGVDATEVIADDEDEKSAPPPLHSDPGTDVDVDAATRVSDRSYQKGPAPDAAPEPQTTGIEPGSVLFGEYEIIEVLGAGGMGEVYKARHRRLGEYRAIKMMHAELSGKKGANEFFLREAKALLAVRHPGVVHCHDLLSDEQGRVYLIMELIEGPSLSELMDEGPLSADDVVVLGARLASGLSAAHACGVVHRDVSPDNVVLPGGDIAKAKLIDFGIAKILQQGQGTIVEGFKGKLGYASPEQLGFFGGNIDGRSDFYSLGLVLCAAALGRPMGMGKTVVEAVDARRQLQTVPDEIPVGLRSAIMPLLALDPADRPEMVERLFLARSPAAGVGGSGALGKLWAPIVAALAVAAGVAGFLLSGGGPEPAPGPAPTTASQAKPPEPAPKAAQPKAKAAEPAKTAASAGGDAKPKAPVKRQLTALDKVKIMGLLRGAETALAENRLQSPKGNNAYEKYRSVLALDPENRTAKQGLMQVASRYLSLSRGASSAGRLEEAREYMARGASIAAHHPDLDATREALQAASAQ
jgi:serine/threonine-protein kinase